MSTIVLSLYRSSSHVACETRGWRLDLSLIVPWKVETTASSCPRRRANTVDNPIVYIGMPSVLPCLPQLGQTTINPGVRKPMVVCSVICSRAPS